MLGKIIRGEKKKKTSLKKVEWKQRSLVKETSKLTIKNTPIWTFFASKNIIHHVRLGMILFAHVIFYLCKTICMRAGTRTCDRSCLRTRTALLMQTHKNKKFSQIDFLTLSIIFSKKSKLEYKWKDNKTSYQTKPITIKLNPRQAKCLVSLKLNLYLKRSVL